MITGCWEIVSYFMLTSEQYRVAILYILGI